MQNKGHMRPAKIYELLGLLATIIIAGWVGTASFISQLSDHEARIKNNELNDVRMFKSFEKFGEKLDAIKEELVKQRTLEEERNK